MLLIRDEQMLAMTLALQGGFSGQLAGYLRQAHPDSVAHCDERQLLAAVDAARQRAAAYGFAWQSSVLAFVTLTFTVGPHFDRQPRIRQILSEGHVPADSRIAYLAQAVSEAEWDEARRIAGP